MESGIKVARTIKEQCRVRAEEGRRESRGGLGERCVRRGKKGRRGDDVGERGDGGDREREGEREGGRGREGDGWLHVR